MKDAIGQELAVGDVVAVKFWHEFSTMEVVKINRKTVRCEYVDGRDAKKTLAGYLAKNRCYEPKRLIKIHTQPSDSLANWSVKIYGFGGGVIGYDYEVAG